MPEYIEREAIVLKYEFGMVSDEGIVCIPMRDVKKSIANTPTADVAEVRHGEWIAVPSSDMSTGKAYKCSKCQKMRYGVRLPPYCQECGAKMDKKV